jgi:hypothetical protein
MVVEEMAAAAIASAPYRTALLQELGAECGSENKVVVCLQFCV